MRGLRSALVALVAVVGLIAGGTSVSAHESHSQLDFDSMRPVTGSAVGTVNERGITGGGLPWTITSGFGKLGEDGHVRVKVTGLVIPVAPFNGTNPVPAFGVTVSCITPHGIVNVMGGTAPANAAGDATIETAVALPEPCHEPIVFVTSPGGAWFAASREDGRD